MTIRKPLAARLLISWILLLVATVLLTACQGDASADDRQLNVAAPLAAAEGAPLGRLPATAEPLRYRIRLAIHPDQERFTGESEIDVRLHEATDTLWLHGNQLDVEAVAVTPRGGESIAASYEQVADIGVAKVTLPEVLPAGDATLAFAYSAQFNTNLEGLYKVVAGGRDYAFTQFQATSARLVFPGFDEPRFKVPFELSVELDPEHIAVSSTPVAEETLLDNGNKLLRYQTTKPLPTYLVAFAVGAFDQLVGEAIPATALRNEAVPFAAYAVKGKGDQLQFAIENTADIVLTQENYFGYPYPYEKLAVIAVPDFGAGAMENVGAITYREQLLLQSPTTPVSVKQRFLLVHAHELAHQWFGNLVTPVWWNDIWLNEAFATWMATKTMHQLQPEAGYAQRMLDQAFSTMQVDQLVSARQIRQPIATHADIGAAFDGITYQKGGAVLSMLEGFVGEENFKRGIQRFMKEHEYGNADARDFVQAIASTREDLPKGQVEAAFFSFLEQPDTPLVEMGWQCSDGKATVSITQSRYLPLGSRGDEDKSWVLPLCVAYEANGERSEHCELVDEPHSSFELGACPTVIMPNANASGYYRFSLAEDQWQSLLQSELMNEREQLAAVNSLSAAFHKGQLNGEQYLSLLPPLLESDNTQVVSAPLADLYFIEQYMVGDEQAAAFRTVVDALYRPVYERVGLGKMLDDSQAIRLRSSMLKLFAQLVKDDALRQELHAMATAYVGSDDKALDANIREVALATTVDMEDREFAHGLLKRFLDSQNAVEREEMLRALTHSDDPAFRRQLRELALTEKLRDNEVEHIIEPLMLREETRDDTWAWLRANLDPLAQRLPSWFRGRIIENAAGFCSQERYEEIDAELREQIAGYQRGPRSLAITLEQIQLCRALVDEQKPAIETLLARGE
jgi:alanyl aminopeptidase